MLPPLRTEQDTGWLPGRHLRTADAPSVSAIKGPQVQPPENPVEPLALPPFLQAPAGKPAPTKPVTVRGLFAFSFLLVPEVVPAPHTSREVYLLCLFDPLASSS